MKSILVLFHCESNTGYAIGPLERSFHEMGLQLCDGDAGRVHFAYLSMAQGPSSTLPADFTNYLVLDTRSRDPVHLATACDYVRRHGIDTLFGFDQPVSLPAYAALRRAGIRHFISYWGAAMSSLNPWPILLLKRLQVALARHGPDHYIFESQGMAEMAVRGRGIARRQTSVVPLGVDTDHFAPATQRSHYLQRNLDIPAHRKVFFYSGHMEPRKGVPVIMQAANLLAAQRRIDDWHLLLVGNKGDEHLPWQAMLTPAAAAYVTFGGYRQDVADLHRDSHAAIIASTGWDSLTMSGLECQASGLPLLVSDLPGLNEAVEPGVTGYRLPVGDPQALAQAMQRLLDEPGLRDRLGAAARQRIVAGYSRQMQVQRLAGITRCVVAPALGPA